ncbi:ATPase with role in protein import into the ER [Podila horticola]|nr:ATPase with role in protein import into the ER [Podila horticola]
MPAVKGLVPALVALIVLPFIPIATASDVLTVLAIDITAKYLKGLQTSAVTIIGRNVNFVCIVTPGGNGLQTSEETIIGQNMTRLSTVVTGDNGLEESRQAAISAAAAAAGLRYFTLRKYTCAAFEFENGMEYERAILVYRLGSSTLEVSVVEGSEGTFYTLSSVYDQHLGGNDFNKRVVNHLLLAHKKKTCQDLSSDDKFMIQLGREVEKAKQALSSQNSVRIEIESICPGGQDFFEELTRSQFEYLNMDLFTKTIAAIDQAIRDASIITKDNIQDIVLSGGSSNIPFLQSAIKNYFGGGKNYYGSIHPETTSVFGAARLGAARLGGSDGVCCTFMDELSLGIETVGGVMFKYTDQRSREFNKMFTFSTAMDNQDRVVIKVFEGERARTSHNAFLGGIELSGIPPAPKGVPQIRVRLSGPSCGNQLQLTVMDVATKKMNTTTISPRSAFRDEDEIISKILEGKAFEHEDRMIWENAEATGTWKLLNAP